MSDKKKNDKVLKEKLLDDFQHGLTNQLASIKAFNQLIKRRSEDKEIQDYTDSIEERIGESLELMSEFLDSVRNG